MSNKRAIVSLIQFGSVFRPNWRTGERNRKIGFTK